VSPACDATFVPLHPQDSDKYALVRFLDEDGGAGWELLRSLLAGDTSALELARHRFFSPQPVVAGSGAGASSSKGGRAGRPEAAVVKGRSEARGGRGGGGGRSRRVALMLAVPGDQQG
jgi:hypothetical protein